MGIFILTVIFSKTYIKEGEMGDPQLDFLNARIKL